jgi:hypothetical protein
MAAQTAQNAPALDLSTKLAFERRDVPARRQIAVNFEPKITGTDEIS